MQLFHGPIGMCCLHVDDLFVTGNDIFLKEFKEIVESQFKTLMTLCSLACVSPGRYKSRPRRRNTSVEQFPLCSGIDRHDFS